MSAKTKIQIRKSRERNGECVQCGRCLTDSTATLRIESLAVAWLPHGGRCGPCREHFYRTEANRD